jgi:hypothetical protein
VRTLTTPYPVAYRDCSLPLTGPSADTIVAALQDPEDVLIVDGYPTLDPCFKTGVTVLATTRTLQAAKRTAQTR